MALLFPFFTEFLAEVESVVRRVGSSWLRRSALIINWGVPGIRNHCPDLAVFVGLSHDPRPTGLLDLASLGGRCELVVEVVMAKTRSNDMVAKLDHYYRIGIPLYVIIDEPEENGPRCLWTYRHTPAG